MNTNNPNRTTIDWRSAPATKRQVLLIAELRKLEADEIRRRWPTRGAASDEIDEALRPKRAAAGPSAAAAVRGGSAP